MIFRNLLQKIQSKPFFTKVESFVIMLSIIAMFIHGLFIFLAKSGIILDDFLANQNYLEIIATPFTIILIYEIFLLVISVSKSMSISIGKQYEIITLVLIRDVFKIVSSFDFNANFSSQPEIITSVIIDIFFAIVCFILISFYIRYQKTCFKLQEKHEQEKTFIELKSLISFFLLVIFFILIASFIVNLIQSFNSELFISEFKSISFLSDIFIFMIIFDIVLLLVSFSATHNFKEVFYEAVLIISAIVVRFAFLSLTPWNGILATVGILIGVIISITYSKLPSTKYG